jgi:hypothetical protein
MTNKEIPQKSELVLPRNFLYSLLKNKEISQYFLRHDVGITDENRAYVIFPDFSFFYHLSNEQHRWIYDPQGINNNEAAFKRVFGDYYGNLPQKLGVTSFLKYELISEEEKERSKLYIASQRVPESILCFASCKVKNGSDQIKQVIHFFHALYIEPHLAYIQTHVNAYEHPPKAGR